MSEVRDWELVDIEGHRLTEGERVHTHERMSVPQLCIKSGSMHLTF